MQFMSPMQRDIEGLVHTVRDPCPRINQPGEQVENRAFAGVRIAGQGNHKIKIFHVYAQFCKVGNIMNRAIFAIMCIHIIFLFNKN